jgi:hypothetical protein
LGAAAPALTIVTAGREDEDCVPLLAIRVGGRTGGRAAVGRGGSGGAGSTAEASLDANTFDAVKGAAEGSSERRDRREGGGGRSVAEASAAGTEG